MDDGSIVPNYLGISEAFRVSAFDTSMSDVSLRRGRIVAAYAPSSAQNTSKKAWQYDVMVRHMDGNGSLSDVVYPRAQIQSMFGGVGDMVRWRPRINAEVILACINGNRSEAWIIGAPKNPKAKKDLEGEEQEQFFAEINGVAVQVAQNGDLIITHKGKTADDGSVIDDDDTKNGTCITLDSNGDVKISTGKDAANSIRLDSQNNTIQIQSSDLVVVQAEGNVKIESEGVLTGSATDATLLGASYRTAQTSLHATVMPLLVTLSGLLTTAGAALATAAGVHVIPIAGPIVGAPAMGTAAASLSTAGPLIAQIMAAIQTFEAQGPFLSTKNRSD